MTLTAALRDLAATPTFQLAAIEQRLLRIAIEFLPALLIQLRCANITTPGQEPLPVTGDLVSQAAVLAFRAAVEVEQPLRELRDAMTVRQPAPPPKAATAPVIAVAIEESAPQPPIAEK